MTNESVPDLDAAPLPLDLEAVEREIDAEVRRIRRSGEIPDDYEAELDAAFARHAPAAVSDDFEHVLDQAERDTGFQYSVSTESRLPAGSFVKRAVIKTIGWYVQWFVRQISGAATTITRAVRLLARRVDRLEATNEAVDPRVAEAASALPDDLHVGWAGRVVELLGRCDGRVAVGDAGVDGGALLRTCLDAGIDAYGIEPRLAVVDELAEADLEVRHSTVLEHLERLPDAGLAGLVLVGCAERLPIGELVQIARAAPAKVMPGGRLVVVSSTPQGRQIALGPIAADLSPGHPLAAPTWVHLLSEAGCTEAFVENGEPVGSVGGAEVDDEAVRARLDRIEAVLFPPASYAVVATRG